MFGDVISVKAGTIESLDDLQSLFVILPQRQVIAVEMVETPNSRLIHSHPLELRALALSSFGDPRCRSRVWIIGLPGETSTSAETP